MTHHIKISHLPQMIVVAFVATTIKLFYSTASVNELRWILAPTTFLVELLSGKVFVFESGSGYMSSDHTFLIAASCSGINFLITSFLMLSVGRIWNNRNEKLGWLFLPTSLLAAYLTTVLANTVRISAALQMRSLNSGVIWLNPDQLHRFEGIVVYFGFLFLLFVVNEKLMSVREPDRNPIRPRRWLLPLSIYYLTTIGVPLVNGLYRGGLGSAEFWEHSIFVLLIPILFLITIGIMKFFKDQRQDLRVRNIN